MPTCFLCFTTLNVVFLLGGGYPFRMRNWQHLWCSDVLWVKSGQGWSRWGIPSEIVTNPRVLQLFRGNRLSIARAPTPDSYDYICYVAVASPSQFLNSLTCPAEPQDVPPAKSAQSTVIDSIWWFARKPP